MTDAVTSYIRYDAEQAANDFRSRLASELQELTNLVTETARQNVRYYPNVREHIKNWLVVVANQYQEGVITADWWEAWLEQFGKGSLMAGTDQNPGLVTYMNSQYWNRVRDKSTRIILGRPFGKYVGLDGKEKTSRGGYYKVDLEELAMRGDLPPEFKPTPPTFFMRNALQTNKQRILQGIQNVIETFPYQKYFKMR